VTTGAPIYLVSACASGEEFVAAFRRYADKNGLFIPIAAPIPAGRRGRFAVTLKDGGVMIEGEADIVSSAATPSVLHGRVGMTLRFVEPDIKSKTVLIELEQARLAMKPQPPSVPPRPAQIPAEPRAKVPTIAGRIDANNQLAECVAIGDIDGLEATVPQVSKSGGPRFVVPTIPPVAGGRPKAPTTPPMGYPAAAKPATMPPPVRPHTPSAPPSIPPKPSSFPLRPTGTQPPPPMKPIGTMPPLAKPSGATPPLAKPSGATPPLATPPAASPPLATASGATASGATASGATASGATASGATASGATASGATASGATASGATAPLTKPPAEGLALPRTSTVIGTGETSVLAKASTTAVETAAEIAATKTAAAATAAAATAAAATAAAATAAAKTAAAKTAAAETVAVETAAADTAVLRARAAAETTAAAQGLALPRTSTMVGTSAPAPAPTTMAAQSGPTLVAAPIVNAPVTPMSITTVDAPLDVTLDLPLDVRLDVPPEKPSLTQGWDAAEPEADTGDDSEEGELLDEDAPRDTIAMPAVDPGEAVAALVRSRTPSDELTAFPATRSASLFQAMPPGSDSDTFTAVGVRDGVPEPVPEDPPSISRPNNGATGSGKVTLPPPRRTTGNTQPPPRNPTPSAPLPVVSAKPTLSGLAPVRAPTQIGLPIVDGKRPAPRTGEIPLPPVVAEARDKVATPEVSDEPTDITGVPVVAAEPDDSSIVIASSPPTADPPPAPSRTKSGPILPGTMRKTVMGIAVVPDGVTVLPASPSGPVAKPTEPEIPTVEVAVEQAAVEPYLAAAIASAKKVEVNLDDAAADEPTGKPSITQRPPVIEEPSGDWTMIPGAEGPTILPRKPDGSAADGPPGDWTIARLESSPDGWSAPAKVAPVRPNLRTNTGPPVAMVAGEKPLEVTMTAKAFDIEEETKSGLKVEVDASLAVEPQISAGIDLAFQSTQFAVPSPVIMTPPPGTLSPIGVMNPSQLPPMVRMPSAGSGSFAEYPQASRSSAPADLFAKHAHIGDSTSMIDTGKKKRVVIIVVSAGLAIVVGVVLLIVFGLGGDPKKPGTSPAVNPPPVVDAAQAVAPPVSDATAAVEPAVDATEKASPPSGDCFVEVTSTPSGADVSNDKDVLGVTPAKLTLPCGAEVKLTVRKAKFASSTRSITPTQDGAKLKVTLGKTVYSVKVTSSPPGATITIAGKSAGVTPAMIKLPAGEQTVISIAKPGFAADNPKITPKQNNQSIHVNLKKKGR
jgi:PEGA domain